MARGGGARQPRSHLRRRRHRQRPAQRRGPARGIRVGARRARPSLAALPGEQRTQRLAPSPRRRTAAPPGRRRRRSWAWCSRRSSRSKRKRSSRRTVNSEASVALLARVRRPQGVDERVVGGDLQRGRRRSPRPGACPAPGSCGRPVRPAAGSKRTSQPVGACRPSAAGCPKLRSNWSSWSGSSSTRTGTDLAAGEHVGVERGPHDVVLGGAQRGRHLAVREVRRCAGRPAVGCPAAPIAELSGGAVRVQVRRVGRPGHLARRGERDDGHPQRFGGRPGRGRLVGVPYAHVDRRAEGHGDQQDQDQRLPGQAARRRGGRRRTAGAWSAMRSCAENSWRRAARTNDSSKTTDRYSSSPPPGPPSGVPSGGSPGPPIPSG